MYITVFFQDSSLIVCEKPVGVSSESPGLPDLLAEQTGQKVYPVHRLDLGTGGVIILSFSARSCTAMQRFFQSGQVKKEYLAVIAGTLSQSEGIFEDDLFHDKRTNKTFVVSRYRTGVKHAVCSWTVLQTVTSDQGEMSLIRIILHTGRSHQIRVQFGSRKHPLVGDRKYGSRIHSDSPALWASGITFPHPENPGRIVNAASFPPDIFPWNLFNITI